MPVAVGRVRRRAAPPRGIAVMVWVGTSGYNFPEWRGSFYPEGLPEGKMLPYYAERLPTVEINYTFYRMPSANTVAGWVEQTPPHFKLTLKASRRITHDARLKDCRELVDVFCERATKLGAKLGVILFQLPPFLKKDLALLEGFLALLPPDLRAAFEFRSDTWHDEAVYAALRSRGAALCISDSERLATPVVTTAAFSYYRLRDEGYTDTDLREWTRIIREEGCPETFVYFKHEAEGMGAEYARRLLDLLG